jgi:hypothetical protein
MSKQNAMEVLRHFIQNPGVVDKLKDCTPNHFKEATQELMKSGELDKDSNLHNFIKDGLEFC